MKTTLALSSLLLVVLAGCMPQASEASAPESTPQYTTGWIEHTYAGDYFFAVTDVYGKPLDHLANLPAGHYTAWYSKPGHSTITQDVEVVVGKPTPVIPPENLSIFSKTFDLKFNFTGARNLVILSDQFNRQIVDTYELSPGVYNVLYVGGEQRDIEMVTLDGTTSVEITPPSWFLMAPTPTSSLSYSAPTYTPSTTGGRCWVNGYTKKNGTRVSGYWRKC